MLCTVMRASLVLSLIACVSPRDYSQAADGGDDDAGAIDERGTDHTYVISAIDVPTNNSEAMTLGLDIDDKPDDGIDNQLGAVLGSIAALAPGLKLQPSLDAQIDRGDLNLLVNVKATDLASASGVGVWIYVGTDAVTPPACTDDRDMVCRRHLAGTGEFMVDSTARDRSTLTGHITGGTFTGGSGTVTLRISLGGGAPFRLPMQKAKAVISAITADGWVGSGSKIGGAISQTDLEQSFIPAIAAAARTTFDEDCDVGGAPPGCNCIASSAGASLRNLFDKPPTQDCVITDAEVRAVVQGFLTPDIDVDGDGTHDALSLGLGLAGVRASFTVPPP